jgi:hypothetical protein
VCRRFGEYLGGRYRGRDNLLLLIGGDFTPPRGSEGVARLRAIIEGMKAGGARQLWTGGWGGNTASTDVEALATLVDLNAVYTAKPTYQLARRTFTRRPSLPTFLLETGYEAEAWQPGDPASIRKYEYSAVLGGCTAGAFYGHRDVWEFATETWWSGYPFGHQLWRSSLDAPAAFDMKRMGALLDSVAWQALVPAGLIGMKELVVGGGGRYGTEAWVSAAATPDGSALLAYVPPAHAGPILIDMTALGGPVEARWFDPTTGQYSPIGRSLPNVGTRSFAVPGRNGAGASDWVLALTAPRRQRASR